MIWVVLDGLTSSEGGGNQICVGLTRGDQIYEEDLKLEGEVIDLAQEIALVHIHLIHPIHQFHVSWKLHLFVM